MVQSCSSQKHLVLPVSPALPCLQTRNENTRPQSTVRRRQHSASFAEAAADQLQQARPRSWGPGASLVGLRVAPVAISLPH